MPSVLDNIQQLRASKPSHAAFVVITAKDRDKVENRAQARGWMDARPRMQGHN
jgi:hypothetical protein